MIAMLTIGMDKPIPPSGFKQLGDRAVRVAPCLTTPLRSVCLRALETPFSGLSGVLTRHTKMSFSDGHSRVTTVTSNQRILQQQ